MNCKSCNNPLSEQDQFCRKCGQRSPLAEQRDKVEGIKERQRNLLREKTHSPFFLIISIIFSLVTLSRAASIFYGDYSVLLEGIFMLIATVGFWLCYTAKDNYHLSKALRNASIHDAFKRVGYTILVITASIGVIGVAILLFLLAGFLTTSDVALVDSNIPTLIITAGVVFLIFGLLGILLIGIVRSIFARRRAYFLKLSEYADGSAYAEKKAPVFGSYLLGGVYSVGGIALLSTSALIQVLAAQAIKFIISLLGLGEHIGVDFSEFGDITGGVNPDVPTLTEILGIDFISLADVLPLDMIGGLISDYINALISGLLGILIAIGIGIIIVGAYYILSAVWMQSVHKEALALNAQYHREVSIRAEMEREIKNGAKENAEFRVQSAECRMQNAECRMQNAKFKVQSEDCRGEQCPSEDEKPLLAGEVAPEVTERSSASDEEKTPEENELPEENILPEATETPEETEAPEKVETPEENDDETASVSENQ